VRSTPRSRPAGPSQLAELCLDNRHWQRLSSHAWRAPAGRGEYRDRMAV